MKKEQRDMNMVLIKFTDGPMAGEEREIQNADVLVSEYPGYSPTEQSMDPEHGQCVKAVWSGDEAAEAAYDHRPGMPDSDDSGKGHGRLQRPASSASIGAERRETHVSAKPQVKDRRDK